MAPNDRVVVIAGSTEGMTAVVRLINLLPSAFPAPLVVHLHGLEHKSLAHLARKARASSAGLDVVSAADGDEIFPGCLFVAPPGNELVFTAPRILGLIPNSASVERSDKAERLFESAARFHGSGVVGVVLSGQGEDGTRGLLAVTEAGGSRVVQSPGEATHPAMPSHALLRDHIEYAVLLDQMGKLLFYLVDDSHEVAISWPGLSLH